MAKTREPARSELARRVRMLSGADAWHTVAGPTGGPRALFMADGPHGLRVEVQEDGGSPLSASQPATCFPPAATLACSWDPALAERVGRALGEEARAAGLDIVLGPGLNIKRHPHCGRNFEYFSEDPLLSGRLAAAMVQGIQSEGVGACLKHFAVNNQESNRFVVDAIVDERTLREIYLTGFEIALQAEPAAVMASYNKVNGQNACENSHLLDEVLRNEWGFDGLVMSDWGAVNHRVASLEAGLDLEMPGNRGMNDAETLQALSAGEVSPSLVDASIARIAALAERIATWRRGDASDAGSSRNRMANSRSQEAVHHELAAKAAADSSVLLTNNGVLPLDLDSIKSIAVIGAFARTPRYQGAGSSKVNSTRVESLLDAFDTLGDIPRIAYAPGYDAVTSEDDEELITEAVSAARQAEVAIVMVGLPDRYESEGFDRTSMALPHQHDRLVQAVCDANPRTVVVLSNGSPVELPWADRPAAIIEAYLGGQASGRALLDVLTGSRPPAGRLAESFPLRAADAPSDDWFPGEPLQVEYREGVFVGYRYYSSAGVPVRFPFGHGLSYTTFDYGEPKLSIDDVIVVDPASLTGGFDEGPLTVELDLVNSGMRAGSEVVQFYVTGPDTKVLCPELELAGFAKITLESGARGTVRVPLPARSFSHFSPAEGRWCVAPGEYEIRVGASSSDLRHKIRLSVSLASASAGCSADDPGSEGLLARDDQDFAQLLGRPCPIPPAVRPFHRNSRLLDLRESRLGRGLLAVIERAAASQVDQIADGDPVMAAHMRQSGLEMPLRGLAQLAGGRISWPMVDGLIDVLNGRPTRILRRGWRTRRGG